MMRTVDNSKLIMTAVGNAGEAARPGDVVLLSPACASFDQFRDFEARGDAFRAAVEALDGYGGCGHGHAQRGDGRKLQLPAASLRSSPARRHSAARPAAAGALVMGRSEEHTAEIQSLMRLSYA